MPHIIFKHYEYSLSFLKIDPKHIYQSFFKVKKKIKQSEQFYLKVCAWQHSKMFSSISILKYS